MQEPCMLASLPYMCVSYDASSWSISVLLGLTDVVQDVVAHCPMRDTCGATCGMVTTYKCSMLTLSKVTRKHASMMI